MFIWVAGSYLLKIESKVAKNDPFCGFFSENMYIRFSFLLFCFVYFFLSVSLIFTWSRGPWVLKNNMYSFFVKNVFFVKIVEKVESKGLWFSRPLAPWPVCLSALLDSWFRSSLPVFQPGTLLLSYWSTISLFILLFLSHSTHFIAL